MALSSSPSPVSVPVLSKQNALTCPATLTFCGEMQLTPRARSAASA
jgi:hypothetical protein